MAAIVCTQKNHMENIKRQLKSKKIKYYWQLWPKGSFEGRRKKKNKNKHKNKNKDGQNIRDSPMSWP